MFRGFALQPSTNGDQNYILTAANRLECYPFFVKAAFSLHRMRCNLSVIGTAASLFRMGLYTVTLESGGGGPGRVLVDSGDIAADTTGIKTFIPGADVFLYPGLYYAVMVCNGATPPKFTGPTGQYGYHENQFGIDSAGRPVFGGYISFTYGALTTNPAGSFTAMAAPVATGSGPHIGFEGT